MKKLILVLLSFLTIGTAVYAQNAAPKMDVGQKALNFTQNNTQGIPVSLSSLKGKYVLIDFWASWCGPCRKENPNVVKVYERFKGKNFEIIAVSLDDKKEKWLQAIEADKLPWINVCSLEGLKGPILRQYNITGVPTNFLLDPHGVIIAKELHGDELGQKLEEVLGAN